MWKGVSGGTICAIATGSGIGGIAVLRVSGPDARSIASNCCKSFPSDPVSHHIYYTTFVDPKNSSEIIDSCLVSYFEHGRSFTGEETIEISCHGGTTVPQLILNALISCGARLANPGEFTARAFFNGKLDLVQAEAVLQLIESGSQASARMAVRQLRGDVSAKLLKIEDDIVWALSHLEASIDYSEQGIELVAPDTLNQRILGAQTEIRKLLKTYRSGQHIRQGFQVAIVGEPNVGKSSLLNSLAGEERAIVTEHAGTTRDFVEAKIFFESLLINFVDTAGLRVSDDPVEKIGIERTIEKMKTMDLILLVQGDTGLDPADLADLPKDVPILSVRSKGDLRIGSTGSSFATGRAEIVTSAKTGEGMELLLKRISEIARSQIDEAPEAAIQSRHFECLTRSDEALSTALSELNKNMSPEFVAFELQRALDAVFEVSGKKTDEQVLDRVFKEFCLGK